MKAACPTEKLFTVGESATSIGVSPDSIRNYERRGILPAAFKTQRGIRLFRAIDVEKLRAQREGRKA